MAQATMVADSFSIAGPSSANLSDRQNFELQQYKKIVQFSHDVLSGKHPTFKAPPGSNPMLGPLSLQKTVLKPRVDAKHIGSSHGVVSSTASAQASSSGRPELNPLFLEKSEHLVRAEVQIQRQRLERAIKEEVEHRRGVKSGQPELIPDFDLSDVLAKALVLVQTTSGAIADGENLTANAETASDSLDDSTFYSSRHDTPESHLASIVRNQSEEPQATNFEARETTRHVNQPSPKAQGHATDIVMEAAALRPNGIDKRATAIAPVAPTVVVPGLNNYIPNTLPSSDHRQETSNVASRLGDRVRLDIEADGAYKPSSASRHSNGEYLDSQPASPLVRNHALQPLAPQPTHPPALTALATASSAVHDTATSGGSRSGVGTPAQVAALRTESNLVTSPDSSSQGGKKKGKKKKRKANRQAAEAEAAPYIKPEPKSPSPMTAPSYIRPNKRQRHGQAQSSALQYEPRYEPIPIPDDGVQYVTRQYREEPIPVGYARPAHHQPPPGDVRYHQSGEYYDVRQVRGEDLGPRSAHVEPSMIAYPARAPSASRPLSRVMVADPYAVSSRPQYREYNDGSRIAGPAEGDAFIAPSRPAPARILVDAYGREYIEPPHHPPSRLSVASPPQHGEPDILYERFPPRSVSRHPAPGPYEDAGAVYTAPNQAYVMPRRVVTQPEYATHDYRDVRQREFSGRPPPPHGEFVQVLAPQDRRYLEETFGGGQPSMRPVETVRYQLPPDYGRIHSVRPEAQAATDFRASARPEGGRRELLQPYMREYRTGHLQEPQVPRAMSVRPAGRPLNEQVRGGEDIAFIERPRGATQEIVYADDARREVYR